jgi:hypothetical protein
MKRRSIYLIAAVLLGFWGCLDAQGLEDDVSVYESANGALYLQPLADAFGANLNSGFFRSARIPRWGFHIELGVKAMGAFISEEQQSFTSVAEDGVVPAGEEIPTIFGKEESQEIDGFEFPGGIWNTSIFPTAVPQLTVGSVFGTEAMIRWISYRVNDDIGEISLLGLGARHSLSQYIPYFPVDVALGYYWQGFKVGDIVEARATYVGLQASYNLSVLCFYTGIGYETAGLDIGYDHEEGGDTVPIRFELDGKNATRFTIGLFFDLPIVKFHVDYSIAAQHVVAAGFGFGI